MQLSLSNILATLSDTLLTPGSTILLTPSTNLRRSRHQSRTRLLQLDNDVTHAVRPDCKRPLIEDVAPVLRIPNHLPAIRANSLHRASSEERSVLGIGARLWLRGPRRRGGRASWG
jgi:hypothetical protein